MNLFHAIQPYSYSAPEIGASQSKSHEFASCIASIVCNDSPVLIAERRLAEVERPLAAYASLNHAAQVPSRGLGTPVATRVTPARIHVPGRDT
jgi:hypothetical protein